MTKLSENWLQCLLFAVTFNAACSATASSYPALDFNKPVFLETIENVHNRKIHTLKSDMSYANYFNHPTTSSVALPASIVFPFFPQQNQDSYSTLDTASYYNDLDEYISSFHNEVTEMPKVSKKSYVSSKIKDLLPYIKSRGSAASRVWHNIPSRHEIVDRTIGAITSGLTAIGLATILPVILVTAALFVVFTVILFLFPAVSAFGRRRVGRDLYATQDLGENLDFDRILPPEQSRTLTSLAARLDSVLDTYMNIFKDDACLERYSCEAGQTTSRWDVFSLPIITYLESLLPAHMYEKIAAFKKGVRRGSIDCSKIKCNKFSFIG